MTNSLTTAKLQFHVKDVTTYLNNSIVVTNSKFGRGPLGNATNIKYTKYQGFRPSASRQE